MKYFILILILLLSACGRTITAPEPCTAENATDIQDFGTHIIYWCGKK